LAVTEAVTVLVPAAPEVADRLSQVAESDAVQVVVEVTVSDVLVAVEPGFQAVGATVNVWAGWVTVNVAVWPPPEKVT
jgi:hypothetical protein